MPQQGGRTSPSATNLATPRCQGRRWQPRHHGGAERVMHLSGRPIGHGPGLHKRRAEGRGTECGRILFIHLSIFPDSLSI
jgi:hypothetical protein